MPNDQDSKKTLADIPGLVREIERDTAGLFSKARDVAKAANDFKDDISRIRIVTDDASALGALSDRDAFLLKQRLVASAFEIKAASTDFGKLGEKFINILPSIGPTGVISMITATVLETPVSESISQTFTRFSVAQSDSDAFRDLPGKCLALINALGCDVRSAGPLSLNSDLLKQAIASFKAPAYSDHNVGAPLFSIRQCIQDTLESLKRRLPPPQVCGGMPGMIREILRRAGKPGMNDTLADELAREAAQLHDKLSGDAKRDNQSRAATLSLLSAALNFLYRFLSSVDPEKLRAG